MIQDKDALFESIYQRYYRYVWAIAYKRVGNFQIAEDITQDVFIKVYAHMDKVYGDTPTKWLTLIAINVVIDYHRSATRKNDSLPSIPESYDAIQDDFTHASNTGIDISKLLRLLTERDRQVFYLYDVLGYTTQEVMQKTGLTYGGLKNRITIARHHLRQRLIEQAS